MCVYIYIYILFLAIIAASGEWVHEGALRVHPSIESERKSGIRWGVFVVFITSRKKHINIKNHPENPTVWIPP